MKTVHFSGSAPGLTDAEMDAVLNAAQSWHDPQNDNNVNHVNVAFDDDTEGEYVVQIALRQSGVSADNIQPAIDSLATAINNLEPRFGTVEEIKDDLRVD